MLNKNEKQEIVKKYAINDKDTGSSQVQIALIGKRIEQISGHLKVYPKDFHSRHGLLKLVGQRRRLLRYLGRTNPVAHAELVASLGLRSK